MKTPGDAVLRELAEARRCFQNAKGLLVKAAVRHNVYFVIKHGFAQARDLIETLQRLAIR